MDLFEKIRGGRFSPIYLIWGDNTGEIVDFTRLLRESLFNSESRQKTGQVSSSGDGQIQELTSSSSMQAFNHERFDGPYVRSIAEVLQACEQIPFSARFRLVELSQPESFGRHRKRLEQDDSESVSSIDQAIAGLLSYFSRPNPRTILLITSSGLSGTSKLVKAAKRESAVVEYRCEIPKEAQSVAMLQDFARQRHIELSVGSARQLIAAVGSASSEWSTALDRAVAFSGSHSIDWSHLQAVVSTTRQVEVFAFTDAISRRDIRTSLEVLTKLFGTAERDQSLALRTLGLLIWQMRRLCVAKFSSDPEVALSSKPFAVRQLMAQAREFRPEQLRSAYAGLLRLDQQLKGASAVAYASPQMALQRWVFEVCGMLPPAQES